MNGKNQDKGSKELPTIRTNEVKKGAIVTFKDGYIGEVWDNKNGNLRMVKIESLGFLGNYDYGDEYVWKWDTVVQDEIEYKVELTPQQVKMAKKIEDFWA